MMQHISVYDSFGKETDVIVINDTLIPINGRVTVGTNCYYKGIGVPYSGHWLDTDNDREYAIVKKAQSFYMGNLVKKNCFIGKTGIFQEKYQPQFTDFIGSCGAKELSLIENSKLFERSSVDILDVVNYDKANSQYYFKLNYKCYRRKFVDSGEVSDLRLLIDYMVNSNWCFIWDKQSITDISAGGFVSDVADIFYSTDLDNSLGSVYSILYSLHSLHPRKLMFLLGKYSLRHRDSMDFVFNAIEILRINGKDVSHYFVGDRIDTYKDVVLNHLTTGRNCGHCCYIELGEKIKAAYVEKAKLDFSLR